MICISPFFVLWNNILFRDIFCKNPGVSPVFVQIIELPVFSIGEFCKQFPMFFLVRG